MPRGGIEPPTRRFSLPSVGRVGPRTSKRIEVDAGSTGAHLQQPAPPSESDPASEPEDEAAVVRGVPRPGGSRKRHVTSASMTSNAFEVGIDPFAD
jgi:hypothetical protein